MQLQLHWNPGLLDYEAGTPITSPVGFTISLLRIVFLFFFLLNVRRNLNAKSRPTFWRDFSSSVWPQIFNNDNCRYWKFYCQNPAKTKIETPLVSSFRKRAVDRSTDPHFSSMCMARKWSNFGGMKFSFINACCKENSSAVVKPLWYHFSHPIMNRSLVQGSS